MVEGSWLALSQVEEEHPETESEIEARLDRQDLRHDCHWVPHCVPEVPGHYQLIRSRYQFFVDVHFFYVCFDTFQNIVMRQRGKV